MLESNPAIFEVTIEGAQPDYAIYIGKYLVRADDSFMSEIYLPVPVVPSTTGSLVASALLLPLNLNPNKFRILPKELQSGLAVLWTSLDDIPLLVPSHIKASRTADADLMANYLVTPALVEPIFDQETVGKVAWSILSRLDPVLAMKACAQLASASEIYQTNALWQKAIAELLHIPPIVRNRVISEVSKGHPVLHSTAIRWILREIAAAWRTDRWEEISMQNANEIEDWLGRGWFSCWNTTQLPSLPEVLTAIWMLHDLHITGIDEDFPLSSLSSMSYSMQAHRTPVSVIERWLRIWQIDDDHPSVEGNAVPSTLRLDYQNKIGVSPTEMLSGVLLYLSRVFSADPVLTPHTMEDVLSLQMDAGLITLSQNFASALSNNLIATIDQFANQVLRECHGPSTSVGDLPPNDTVSCRTAPILEFPDGQLIVHSLQMLADQTADLYRWSRTDIYNTQLDVDMANGVGHLFQAYVHDLIETLEVRYLNAYPRELEGIATGKSCDFVICNPLDGSYLFVESSILPLPRGIADGDADAVRTLIGEKYVQKATQIYEMIDQDLIAVKTHLHGPGVAYSSGLIVTERSLFQNYYLANEISHYFPWTGGKLIVGVEEFETLVEYSSLLSIPMVIFAWQEAQTKQPLSIFLERYLNLVPTLHLDGLSSQEWLDLLPLETVDAASDE